MQSPDLAIAECQTCRDCGTQVTSRILCCPGCGALIHGEQLKRLAAEAEHAPTAAEALALWRQVAGLLPSESRQHATVLSTIEKLCAEADRIPQTKDTAASPKPKRSGIGWLAGLGALVGILSKSKFLIAFLLTKGKLLLLGLTKASTLFTMLASFGVYWSAWGWKFAAGLVGSIYIHEMGHVAALRRLGVQASAPMFIPGVGALVRLKEALPTAIEDARVGLAGPIWGLGAAVLAWIMAWATHSPFWAAIAQTGAWLNLFNLTPIWQLDGSRAFRALNRIQRIAAAAALLIAFVLTKDGLLLLVFMFAGFRIFTRDAAERPDKRTLLEYISLVALLSLLCWWHPA